MNIHPLLALRPESAQYHAGNVEVLEESPISNPGHGIPVLEEQEAYYVLKITYSTNPNWEVGTFLDYHSLGSTEMQFLRRGIKSAAWYNSSEDATRILRIFNDKHGDTKEGKVGAAVMKLECSLKF